jgi:Spy/CpxP family protein refolding chaperone
MSHIVQENQVWTLFSHTRQDKENGVHTKQQEEQDVITSDNFDYNLIYK